VESRLAVVEKLLAAKSFETVVQIQTEYAKAAYADFAAQVSKMGELHSNLAKAAFKRLNRGSAPHGASGARKRNVGWEARNKLNVAAPGPERRLIIIRCIELLDRDRSSRRLSPDAGLIAVGKFDTGLFQCALDRVDSSHRSFRQWALRPLQPLDRLDRNAGSSG
jgi:Phasin protein